MTTIRNINLVLTGVGAAAFALLFAYIALAPKDFDQRTRDFAIAKVKDRVDEEVGEIAQSETADTIAAVAGIFSDRLEERVENLQASLDAGVASFIADVLAAACKLDCERRAQAEQAVTQYYEATIARYGFALDNMRNLIEGEYDEIMGELRGDLKIFTGTSFIALFFAFMLAIFRGPAAKHLLPFSIMLTVATILAATWYVLGQDWVMTVIFSKYWGWGYPTLLGVIMVFLADIAFNRAYITSTVLNSISEAFKSGIEFSPC